MIYLDSNVLIAAASQAHPHFEASNALLEQAASGSLMTSGHAFAEVFAVLTRLPDPALRFAPEEAGEFLGNWRPSFRIVALSGGQAADEVSRLAGSGATSGGRVYDALHFATAREHGAAAVATWNVRHLVPYGDGLRVDTPTALG